MSYLNDLRVVLWKNMHMRKYYLILTGMEVIIPITIFCIGLKFRHVLDPVHQEKQGTSIPYFPHKKMLNMNAVIGYAPENSFTSKFMAQATKQMKQITTTGKNNYSDLKKWLINVTLDKDELMNATMTRFSYRSLKQATDRFGVYFESEEDDKKFRYSIVMLYKDLRKDTRKMFSNQFTVAFYDKEDEYLSSGFVAVQLLLDKTFIRMKSNFTDKDLSYFNVSMKTIPYQKDFAKRNPEDLIYHLILIGFIFMAATTPYYIATEKHSGMRVMMKMIGISEISIWFGWITYSLLIYFIVVTIMAIILKINLYGVSVYPEPYFSNIGGMLLWVIFGLYCIANLFFLFAISSIVSKHWIAVVCSVFASFVSASPFGLTQFTNYYDEPEWRIGRQLLLCLCPNLVMYNALKALLYFQLKGNPTDWDSFLKDIDDPQILSLRWILIYFIMNILLNGIAIALISLLFPGRYGHKMKLFSFLPRRKQITHPSEYETIINHFIEPVDENDIGIQFYDVHKTFGYFTPRSALKNINLNILRGEITVILGHNGAGKTTLLNVMCGMFSSTSGGLFQNINGELRSHPQLVGKLGFCPQNMIYFNYLTVEEHILFFGMARGLSPQKATREAHYVMNFFNIQDQAGSYVYELSGGTRRKLGLLIAMIGRPEIIILDEPTSGMDVNSRRSTWDLLKKMRKNRIIIMTTHDMEEADVIGNRIAIMHDGEVFCYGSSNFLKELFGTGYNLTLFKGHGFDMEKTTQLIQDVIPSASVTSSTTAKIEYNLPLLATSMFATLFRRLESKMSSLSFTQIHMSCTTMDQVFMNVTFLAGKGPDKSVDISLPSANTPIELRTGISLIFYQIFALFMKKFMLTSRRHHRFLSSAVIAAILGFLNVEIINMNFTISSSIEENSLDLTLKQYVRPMACVDFSGKHYSGIMEEYKKYVEMQGGEIKNENEKNTNDGEGFHLCGGMNLYNFRDNVIAAMLISNENKTIYYNELIPHSPPISVNTYTNSVLRYFMKNMSNEDFDIKTRFHSVPSDEYSTFCLESDSSLYLPMFWWVFVFHSAVLTLFVLFTAFVISQRSHGIKHIQTMSNLSEWTYWLGNFIFDFSIYCVIMAFNVLSMKIFDTKNFFDHSSHLKYFIMAIFFYGISGLAYCYVFSSLFDSISVFMLINVILNISCLVFLLVLEVEKSSFAIVLKFISAILPPFSFLNFLLRYLLMEINHNCCTFCPDSEKELCITIHTEEIENTNIDAPVNTYFGVIDPPIDFIYCLIGDIFIYGILLLVINSRLGSGIYNFLVDLIFGKNVVVDPNDEKEADKYVQAEKDYLEYVFNSDQPSDHALMVYNMKKNLLRVGMQKFTPVAGVNFYVNKGSCFGIVGINGAGKSTTFKILTGYMLPTEGDAKVHNISLRKQSKKYKSMIGSCPQMDVTFEELSAKEMLHLFATLRGLKNADEHVKNWISILDMDDYQDNLIQTYSTGGRRKLCVALSLIGDPRVIFLDEPTSGVDPLARQYMYQIIKSKKSSGQSVVIASHNMRECEILCDRVTVLHNGILKRIGSITALKKQYANGFTLVIKLRLISGYPDIVATLIAVVLQQFEEHRCLVRDQRLGLLQFRILSEKILWSEMFGKMEDIKSMYQTIIEDFTITNATIAEEVFISSLDDPIRSLDL